MILRCTSRKFTVKVAFEVVPDNDIFEMFCAQNEKDRAHMVKESLHVLEGLLILQTDLVDQVRVDNDALL